MSNFGEEGGGGHDGEGELHVLVGVILSSDWSEIRLTVFQGCRIEISDMIY